MTDTERFTSCVFCFHKLFGISPTYVYLLKLTITKSIDRKLPVLPNFYLLLNIPVSPKKWFSEKMGLNSIQTGGSRHPLLFCFLHLKYNFVQLYTVCVCISASRRINICSKLSSTLSEGFITSPGYPARQLSSSLDCSCQVGTWDTPRDAPGESKIQMRLVEAYLMGVAGRCVEQLSIGMCRSYLQACVYCVCSLTDVSLIK